ncbi:MAG: alpha/beta hydrolase [Clostridiales bacterium]|nr:alpha/beta hydrolase [Clostridiales bacterium]
MKKSRTPPLFIHGDADTLVPPEMVYRLYDAAAGPKDILIAGGASHCTSANTLGAAYWEKVFEFTERSGKVLEKTNL